MSESEHAQYVIPCPNPGVVAEAVRAARLMLTQTNQRIGNVVNVPEDPRMHTPVHAAFVDVFKVDPGMGSTGQVREVRQNFGLLAQAAARMETRCVSQADPMCGQAGQLGHNAFAEVGASSNPIAYLCPSFFNAQPATRARALVHELAHARLAIGHAGGEFLAYDRCSSPLRSFRDAIRNAYSYDVFADCLAGGR